MPNGANVLEEKVSFFNSMGNTTQDRGSHFGQVGKITRLTEEITKYQNWWCFTGMKFLCLDDRYLNFEYVILLQFWNIGKYPESGVFLVSEQECVWVGRGDTLRGCL